MKRFIIIFSNVFILSLTFTFLLHYFSGSNPLDAELPVILSDSDTKKLISSIDKMHKNAADFDELFYRGVSNDHKYDTDDLRNMYENKILKYRPEVVNSQVMQDWLSRADFYMRSAMKSKIDMLTAINDTEFVSAVDSMMYSYSAAEAVFRLISKLTGTDTKVGRAFLPDEVSDTILNKKGKIFDNSEKDNYDKSFVWFLSVSSLSTSFDVFYLQILMGRASYSQLELVKINKEMRKLLDAMYGNLPPRELGERFKSSYLSALKSYREKLKLSEYLSFAFLQDYNDFTYMTRTIYSIPNITRTVSGSVRSEAFHTLGVLATIELFSQNYK